VTATAAAPRATATPTLAPTPTPTPTETLPPPTATLDYSRFEGQFSTYENDEFGFAFDYPAIHDQEPFQFCAPLAYGSGDGVSIEMGPGMLLSIVPAEGRTTDSYVDETLAGMYADGSYQNIEVERGATVGSLVGVGLSYRFGATNRFAAGFVFSWRGNIYVAQYLTYGGFACDVPEASVSEFDLLGLMLGSFRFNR
jgi:hypothetical protein